ncbi:MAG: hypothetical protein ABSH09_13470 [Bryobacteraceae bacterium]
MHRLLFACLPCLLATSLFAQPQIGGGTCSSSSLTGSYSLTLTARDVSSSASFTKTLQGIGTATFDGLSKATFNLTNNTNQTAGMSQTWSGTYSMQSNCVGVVTITTGDTASFGVGVYNEGKDYVLTGQDGVYSFTGSGSLLPATCPASIPAGSYPFNGSGFTLSSGAITGVLYSSGLIQFSGTNALTTTASLTADGTSVTTTTTGTYTLNSDCTATATETDTLGNTYALVFTFTSAMASNFIFSGASSQIAFSGSGRIL